jgi:hypothetical protein
MIKKLVVYLRREVRILVSSLFTCTVVFLRLPVLMDLYIYLLYVLVSQILSSILNSSALIHPLYHPLSTLSSVGPTCHFI